MLNREIALTGNFVRIAAAAVMLCTLVSSPASSRQWRGTPDAIAREYAFINDQRADGQLIMLMWFVPQMVRPDIPGVTTMISMLQKNVVLMIVHARLDKTSGTISFDDVDALEPKDQTGRALAPIARDELAPMTLGAVTTVETMFRQSLGAMGKGAKLFVYEAGGVDSCGKGRLSVAVAGETYTWDTPFASCQAK